MDRIAVIIPAHNRAEMLYRAILSVLRQTRIPDEFVVVDDGSGEDLSSERSLIESHDFRWVRLEPFPDGRTHGPGPARNAGVSATSADWISFLDSDDEWEPEKLALQSMWHKQHRDVLLSQVNEQWFRDGKPFRKPRHLRQPSGNLFEESCLRCAIGPSCTMMHRDLWAEFGGFDPAFRVCEDYELWLRITNQYQVGLIEGAPLSRKQGGHADQLSVAVPLLERFRLLALVKLLRSETLGDGHEDVVRSALDKFADQLRKYSEKANGGKWVPVLTALIDTPFPTDSLVKELWGQLIDPKERF